jgi:hypothetical protein
MSTLVDLHVGQCMELRSNVVILRDDQCPLDRHTEDIVGAESHRGRSLADRGDPDRAGGSSQRTGNRATTGYLVQARLKQLEQKTATGIGRIHKKGTPQVWGVNCPE